MTGLNDDRKDDAIAQCLYSETLRRWTERRGLRLDFYVINMV